MTYDPALEIEITRKCPDCGGDVSFDCYKGWTISPIVCDHCKAMLYIFSDDDWYFRVAARINAAGEIEDGEYDPTLEDSYWD